MVQSLIQRLSSTEVLARKDNPDVKIVDVRSLAAYNGWHFNAIRGGHIPGALSFPNSWISKVDEQEIERLLKVKQDKIL